MTTVEDFIWQLERHVYDPDTDSGDIERPLGSNNVPGITDRCGCNATWCAWCNMELSVCLTDAGIEHNCWSVPLERNNAINGEVGFTWIDDPTQGRRGDWSVYDWDGDGSPDHIEGIVMAFDGGGNPLPDDDGQRAAWYHTIGGNVADRCLDQKRTVASRTIMGFVRPPYAAAPDPVVPQPDQPTTPTTPTTSEDDDMPGPNMEANEAADFVDGLYERYLGKKPDPNTGKHPDPAGRHYWVGLVLGGASLLQVEASFFSEAQKRNFQ